MGDTTDTPQTSVKTENTKLIIFVGERHNTLDRTPLKLQDKNANSHYSPNMGSFQAVCLNNIKAV